jgi:hypothetical protein
VQLNVVFRDLFILIVVIIMNMNSFNHEVSDLSLVTSSLWHIQVRIAPRVSEASAKCGCERLNFFFLIEGVVSLFAHPLKAVIYCNCAVVQGRLDQHLLQLLRQKY